MALEFHSVTKDRWNDFEELFECKGGPHNCWCMAWRANENKKSIPGKSGKKLSIKRRIDEGVPVVNLGTDLCAQLTEKIIPDNVIHNNLLV